MSQYRYSIYSMKSSWSKRFRKSKDPGLLGYLKTLLLFALCIPLSFSGSLHAQYEFTSPNLIWQDEFSGTAVDETEWTFQLGDGTTYGIPGWGNSEQQYYQKENATVNGGFLTITAKEETVGGLPYTSTRMNTANFNNFTYGRFEMRAKMPIGKGMWPAFWLLFTGDGLDGTGIGEYGGWAASGEIDIMEYLGDKPDEIFGTLHYGQQFPGNVFTGNDTTLDSGTFNDDFHVFAIEWEPGEIRWYLDEQLYATQTLWWSEGGPYPAPFDQDFHIILNLAVGGNLPGNPDASTVFPQEMVVDYIRVYEDQALPTVTLAVDDAAPAADGSVNLTATPSATQGVAKVEFFQGEYKLGEDDTSPYELTVANLSQGAYKLRAVVTDNDGKVNYSNIEDVTVGAGGQGPYCMVPAPIPGMVEAELYDVGGQGVAYDELNAGDAALNRGSRESGNIFRSNEGVDIQPTTDMGGGSIVGFIENGEWAEYTVDVAQAGLYDVTFRLSAESNTGTLRLLFDGVDKSGPINFVPSGDFGTFIDVTVTGLDLDAGVQVMRLSFEGTGMTVNKMTFVEAVPPLETVFDDMEHGDPSAGNNGWFEFGGSVGSGGIGAGNSDPAPKNAGNWYLSSSWQANGADPEAGFFGGFGRTNPTDLTDATHFNLWINPAAGEIYNLEINLQDDDNGDGDAPFPLVADDEFWYILDVGGADSEVAPGGGWQLVSIPLADFVDKNPGVGNDVLDGIPTADGGNGELINVVVAVVTESLSATFDTDYWVFTDRPATPEIGIDPVSYDFGTVRAGICSTQPFLISNDGICDLVISELNFTGTDAADFSSSASLPLTIPGGAKQFIQVTFGPNTAGPKSATLSIVSNDPDESPLEVALSGTGEEVTEILVDDLNHGAPFDNGWFAFSGDVGGGGIAPSTDTPPDVGGSNSLTTGWGSGGTAGFYGGFTKEFPVDLSGMEFFSFWIKPTVASEEYTIEINFQDDDDGDGIIPFPPDGGDDEFQYNLKVGGVDSEVTPGGGWQRVIIPLADLFDDNSFHFGGNGVFDPFSTVCGGNGQLLNIVYVVIGTGTDANFIIDQIEFLSELTGPDIDVPSPLAFGDVFVNNCSVQTLTVSNVGGTDLSVSSATLSGSGDFSILSGGAPFTVTGGGTHDIEILFTPTSLGDAEATLTIDSDDPDESSVEVSITGTGSEDAIIVFDDMEHGDPTPGNNGWFQFPGDPDTGGGFGPTGDVPPVAGGSFAQVTGWGGANPGIYGGFGRTFPLNVFGTTHFNMWIRPFDPADTSNTSQEYILQIQLQEDDNGDNTITPADDEEWQYNLKVGGADAEVPMNGQWQLVSIPLSDFFKDTGFLTGGNNEFDPLPAACGGNGQLIAIAITVQGIAPGQAANFRTDYWSFSNGPLEGEIVFNPDPVDFGEVVLGSCAKQTVTISNDGFKAVEIAEILLDDETDGDYQILSGGDPVTLGPGESQDVEILFSPSSEVIQEAYLTLFDGPSETGNIIAQVDLIGTSTEPGTLVFDDMEHGNPTPGNNGWFQFPGDPDTGGGYGPITDDLPPTLGGTTAVVTGWGGANPGIYGGFGRNFPLDISQSTHFNFWINPLDPANPSNMDQEFILQIQLQEDDNGDGMITPDADDEYQYNLKVGGDDAEVIAGGGWQFVSIPLSEFFYDNSFLFGGNQVFDPVPTVCGGNGELIAIAITVQGIAPGQAANFRMDYLAFSTGPLGPEIVATPNPVDFGEVTATTCAQEILTITNGGVVPLEIEAMNFMGVEPTPFSILEGDAPVTILPEETHEVILSFKPEDREAYEEILQIISNDTADSPLEVLLMGQGAKPGVVVFDDMEHGNPFGNGWFAFNGAGGGGLDPNFVDLPPANGGTASIQTGWGGPANTDFGGFGRTSPTDIGTATHFNFWINPNPGQEYILKIQIQEDDNGDNAIPFPATGDDDEWQYDLKVGGADAEVDPDGGWQFVSIPLADFYDDNSFLFGGNGVFDPVPVSCGGNGQLIAIIFTVQGVAPGLPAEFRTDYWSFSNGPVVTSFVLVDADSNTDVTQIEDGDLLLLQDLPENFNIVAVVEGAEDINRVVLDLNGPVENERTERKAPYAVFGDRNGNYTGRATEAGMYDITATPYYMDGELVEGTCLSIDFEIGDCDIIGDKAKAGPDQELDCVTGEASLQGSVTAGPMMAPYMVAWSGPNGFSTNDLTPTVTEAGVYTLTITGGVTGCVSVDEVVVEPCQEDCEPETSRFVLVNSNTNEDIMVLEDDATIDLTIVGRALNIRAEVLCGDKTESMRMVLTGAQSRTRTENKAPYALAGDSNGNYSNQNFIPGDYQLRATPYTEKNAQGDMGTQLRINFTVQNGGPATQTGFEDPSLDPQSELSVFPVPANGEFFIDMKFFEEGVYDAAIFDVAGRVVMSQKLVYDAAAEKRFTIKSDQLSVGVYMVRVSGQNYQTWRKITIRR